MIAAALKRHPQAALAGGALLGGLAIAFAPGELGAAVARAGLLAVGLGAAAALLRRRQRPATARRLELLERVVLKRDGEAVLLRLDGRTLLLGVGRDGVRLLAESGAIERGRP